MATTLGGNFANTSGLISQNFPNNASGLNVVIINKDPTGADQTTQVIFPFGTCIVRIPAFKHPIFKIDHGKALGTQGTIAAIKFREPTKFCIEITCLSAGDKDQMEQSLRTLGLSPIPFRGGINAFSITNAHLANKMINRALLEYIEEPEWTTRPMTWKLYFHENLSPEPMKDNGAKNATAKQDMTNAEAYITQVFQDSPVNVTKVNDSTVKSNVINALATLNTRGKVPFNPQITSPVVLTPQQEALNIRLNQ